MKHLRGWVVGAALVVGAGWYLQRPEPGRDPKPLAGPEVPLSGRDGVREAFEAGTQGRMLRVAGRVQRLLADDRDGSPHQRFIIATKDGQTLLVAHNISLAPRLDGIAVGDPVRIYGQYEWNEQGGVLHWTHDDPAGVHEAGYIEWRGRRYQ